MTPAPSNVPQFEITPNLWRHEMPGTPILTIDDIAGTCGEAWLQLIRNHLGQGATDKDAVLYSIEYTVSNAELTNNNVDTSA